MIHVARRDPTQTGRSASSKALDRPAGQFRCRIILADPHSQKTWGHEKSALVNSWAGQYVAFWLITAWRVTVRFRLLICLTLAFLGQNAFAQYDPQLPTMYVTSTAITLCDGVTSCADLRDGGPIGWPEVSDSISSSGGLATLVPLQFAAQMCSPVQSERESVVWTSYRQTLIALFDNNQDDMNQFDQNFSGSRIYMSYTNGQSGWYTRTSASLSQPNGFDETLHPDCSSAPGL